MPLSRILHRFTGPRQRERSSTCLWLSSCTAQGPLGGGGGWPGALRPSMRRGIHRLRLWCCAGRCPISPRPELSDSVGGGVHLPGSQGPGCIRRHLRGSPRSAQTGGWRRLAKRFGAVTVGLASGRQWLGVGWAPWRGGRGGSPPFQCIPTQGTPFSAVLRQNAPIWPHLPFREPTLVASLISTSLPQDSRWRSHRGERDVLRRRVGAQGIQPANALLRSEGGHEGGVGLPVGASSSSTRVKLLLYMIPPPQGCSRREGTSEAAPEAVKSAVGEGCPSGWGRLLSVIHAIEAGICRQGEGGWA